MDAGGGAGIGGGAGGGSGMSQLKIGGGWPGMTWKPGGEGPCSHGGSGG